MARPRTFEEYLASLVPPSVRGVDRRTMLAGGVSLSALALAGCGDGGTSATTGASGGGGATAATGEVTLGSNQSDAVPKAAVQAVVDAFQGANSGLTVKVNTIDQIVGVGLLVTIVGASG